MHDVLLAGGLVLLAKHGVCVASLSVGGWPEARRLLAVGPAPTEKEPERTRQERRDMAGTTEEQQHQQHRAETTGRRLGDGTRQ